ncbi:asparaginase [Anaerofustis sp. NSJ-163]|uniref:asparaginase n=1 Tax=Anaerofustis sp. NSJ-163 TaxID=2944391 RepID=UPI00209C4F7E|nr:asparaginase [Anaerofustis sp. NSJ-163]MCO8192831.1 asparaginase [Anaerofustis sp. NSJ-163]
MKNILLITTGGTIACINTENGLMPYVRAEDILKYIPEIKKICNLTFKQLFNLDSTNIQPEHWCQIANVIKEEYDNYDGFIITHGTDTMSYTACALSYLIQNSKKPIVITGSQKPINETISDAKKNLTDSIRFCLDEQNYGVYVVFDGKVIIGTRARKVRSKSYSAFESINYPISAFIDGERIVKYVEKNEKESSIKFYDCLKPSVFVLKLIPGIEPDILDYIMDNYDAVVIESYGVGGVPFHNKRNFLDKLKKYTKQGKIIVITTQVMFEGSDAKLYEVGKNIMKEYNVLESFDMTVEAVCIKLMWILSLTSDFNKIRELFYKKINFDILTKEN